MNPNAAGAPPGSGAFRAFELAGWEHAAQQYERHWGNLTRQAIPRLLSAVRVKEGSEVLDIASGPGWVSGAVQQRGARVVGVDFSPAMVGRARQAFPAVKFVIGDAEELPFGDERFEVALVNFGLLHLGSPERAIAEAYRVLRPGGRVGFTVWAPPDEAVVFGIVLRAVGACGDPTVPLPPGPPFFRYSDPAEAAALLSNAGFTSSETQRVAQVWRVPSAFTIFEAMHQGTARTGGLLRRQTAKQLADIREAVIDELSTFVQQDGQLFIPMPAILTTAVK